MFQAPSYGAMPDVRWTTSDLCDAHLDDAGLAVQVLQQDWRSFGGRPWYFGRVVTACAAPGTAMSLTSILASPGQGQVLMVDGQADARHAVVGDRMAGLAVQNGWAGIVVNGYVRDCEGLARLPLGIHALGTRPNRAATPVPALIGADFELAGCQVRPGLWVYVDADGIILMRRRHTDSAVP